MRSMAFVLPDRKFRNSKHNGVAEHKDWAGRMELSINPRSLYDYYGVIRLCVTRQLADKTAKAIGP